MPAASSSSAAGSRPARSAWARRLDIVSLVLVAAALLIAVSGGFRVRIAGARLALTSPERLILWALAVSVARHLVWPRPPIYRDLPARIGAAWSLPSVRTAALAAVTTRAAIYLVGYLAIFTVGYGPDRAPWRVVDNEAGNLQARWDTGWYLGIALDGYRYEPGRDAEQQNVVFFPALPLLVRVAGRLMGGSPTGYLLGGTLVVLAAFFGGLIYLYRLARDLLGDEEAAGRAVWLLAGYPFAVFYGAVYTESLFLVGATGAFYHFRRRELWRAAAWGLLVGLTRPNGGFLALPLGVLALTPWLPAWMAGGGRVATPGLAAHGLPTRSDAARARRLLPAIAAAAAPAVGTLLYSVYTWRLAGNPLAWAAGHVAWGRSYQGLSILITERYEYLAQRGLYEYSSQQSNDLIQLLGVLFVLTAAWPVARRFGLAYVVFMLANILPPLAAGGLLSAGRFSSVIFPAFVWLAAAVGTTHWPAWLAAFAALQAFVAMLFYTWRPMF